MDLGATIKSLAKSHGITQSQIASSLDVTQSFVSALYTNKKVPSLDTLLKLCACLNVSPNDLLCYSPSTSPDLSLSPDEDQLVASYRTLSSRDKEAVMVLIRALSNASPQTTASTLQSGSDITKISRIG